ncbi:MAG: DNA-3-methyladenine glycosylase 2 family protein [Deltaproteobacteria bacterium]|nr:DNA-3-methyladenine glycosylase 2 family protein [Deltaproteobacteria bacterium]
MDRERAVASVAASGPAHAPESCTALDPRAAYAAIRARDARFDGRLFVAVRTTRIYCRPICPAKTPAFERCTFHASAAAAERAGYRPCLRCRPELAPGLARVDALSRLAQRAVRRIEDGASELPALARALGVSERHVRRAVASELGVAPAELIRTRRLLLAKQLLTDTRMPVTSVAFASGFESVRRFNAAFRERYRLAPSVLRKSAKGAPSEANDAIALDLPYRAPLAWDALLAFLAPRAIRGVEHVSEGRYSRTVAIGDARGWLRVAPSQRANALRAELSPSLAPVLLPVVARLRALFDLAADPARITPQLAGDAALAKRVAENPGLRVPGAFDGFELLARAILGQQVSVAAATTFAARLADRFGEALETPHAELSRLTPTAARIAGARVDSIAGIGLTRARAETLRAAARACADGALDLAPGADPERVREALLALPGIGPWTADYVLMRAVAWPDAFPHGDLGLRKALRIDDARAVLERSEAWRPWRSYAALHLWSSLA